MYNTYIHIFFERNEMKIDRREQCEKVIKKIFPTIFQRGERGENMAK